VKQNSKKYLVLVQNTAASYQCSV